ncbi:MAG: DNA polymerase III subunit beta [Desertifilum sp.]|nr:DNA polymerase III subunit beta [Desertifilum sp.]
MKFNCKVSDLASAVAAATRVVPNRPTHPILANVLIRAREGKLYVTGYDLSLSLTPVCLAEVEEPGEITLPAKTLNDLISKLPPSETARFSVKELNVTIELSFGSYKIQGISSESYPELASFADESKGFEIESEVLNQALSFCVVATSREETKQVLCGVNIQSTGSCLKFAATDGHRLVKTTFDLNVADELNVTLPSRSVSELIKILAVTHSSATEVTFSPTHAEFFTGNTTLITRNLTGQYPAYEQLIPNQHEHKIEIGDRAEFLSAVQRVGVLSGELIKLRASKNYLKIISRGSDQGAGEETITASANLEEGVDIAFNTKYLTDALKSIQSDAIIINFNKSKLNEVSTPIIFTPSGDRNDIYLLMPVTLKN